MRGVRALLWTRLVTAPFIYTNRGRRSAACARGKQCATVVDCIARMRQHAENKRATPPGKGGAKENEMSKPRISYVDPATVQDPAMIAEFERCRREGTPRPESQAVRAHVPAVFWSFANSWRDVFKHGIADHNIKELCRIYVSRSVKCEYCGNQRSVKAASQGVIEADYRDLINFETSTRYDERQKAALSYAEAITWDLPVDDNSGRDCTRISASRNLSKSATSSRSPWASSVGCAPWTSSTIRSFQVLMPRWRPASRTSRRLSDQRAIRATGHTVSARRRTKQLSSIASG